jgi:hypothetical protein
MRLEFDSSVSRIEQLERTAQAKTPGRKHQKRAGVRANERKRAAKVRASQHASKIRKAFRSGVAAYWKGETDQNPEAAPR